MIFGRRRKPRAERPQWALDTKALNKWKRLYGIELFAHQEAQVIFRDFGEPIAVSMLRPLNLVKDKKFIVGTFLLHDDQERHWAMGIYNGSVNAFVINASPEQLDFIIRHPVQVNYFDTSTRERIKLKLDEHERKVGKCNSKLEGESSMLDSSAWDSISSLREAALAGAPINLQA